MRKHATFIGLIFLLILTSVSPALAADSYTFKGYGYGHGIGMCQWGAEGRAALGQTYEQILSHYYQGTRVTENYSVPSTVRVRLFDDDNLPKVYIEGENSAAIDFIKADGITYAYKGATGEWSVVPTATGLLKLVKPDGTVAVDNLASPVTASTSTGDIIISKTSGKKHHVYKGGKGVGSIHIYSAGSSALYLVHRVQFEPYYLYGLSEVPSSWPYQALYSQVIAARSYAINNKKDQGTYDLYDSVRSQVYNGLDKIRETSSGVNWGARWKKAVDDTARKVITYNGSVVTAYFFSSCGGHTENSENVWSTELPYLKGVSDIDSSGKAYCQQPGNSSFSWSATLSKADLESKLGVSNITGLRVTKKGVSPRIVQLEVIKSDGTKTAMSGTTFRSKLGLKSAWLYQMGGIFPDVSLDYWAAAEIGNLVDRGIIGGFPDGTFQPEEQVTRGQLAKMLCLALGIPSGGSNNFSDVAGNWAEPYISALVGQKLVSGYPDGSFKPNTPVSRAEISVIIARATDLSPGTKQVSFPDINGHWAKSEIEIAASNGLVNGYPDGTFKPNAGAKRSETSVIIYRMFGFMQ